MISVNLRQRTKGNKIYLYLDFYPGLRDPITGTVHRREYLHLSLYLRPKDPVQKNYNREMLKTAEAIRCQKVLQVANRSYGFFDKSTLKMDFLKYYKELAMHKHFKWTATYYHLEKFCEGKCTMQDLDVDFCERFKTYLMNEATKKDDKLLNTNTAAAYYRLFRAGLKQAFKDRYLSENINDRLESIAEKKTKKEFLTLEEVKDLKDTPCEFDVLKRASLFSILTGLRISDILDLKWEQICVAPDGGPCIRKNIVKSDREESIFISEEAVSYCGKRKESGTVFEGLTRSMTNDPLKDWISDAGIDKHITFHCFRHTFATLQIAQGTDIYTVSHQLAHSNVQTTQIYADLVDEKKRASANAVSLK